ncbi:TraB/GumN family protein [Asticcacaulis sp. BYS171W]|uniref:TraB/GumN family protein n=1 Tax=Asticcacaulis aquaticus TaxID=2984212 RepID=A0ABT5HRW3_9CAUL|nr:TraB/GumN family protein [Asticcacaulis aquaticus]MDC7682810.1 TraB/GumN family protein [Asticcacaulis aquaticus]
MRDQLSFSQETKPAGRNWGRDIGIGLGIGAVVIALAFGGEYALTHLKPPPPKVVAATSPTGAPLMWVLKDEDSTIYLFGSIHALMTGTKWADTRLFQAFDTADEVYFEVKDLDGFSDGFRRRLMSSGGNILTGLDETEVRQLQAFARAHEVTTDDLSRLKPWLVGMMIEGQQTGMTGMRGDKGVDYLLMTRAKTLGLPIRGMETPEQQLAYFLNLSDARSRDYLRQSLKAQVGGQLYHLVAAWQTGDEALLARMIAADKASDPALHQGLLVNRNTAWVRRIETMMAGEGHIFITVGAGHLVGEDSVITMLRQRGFTVTRVDPS